MSAKHMKILREKALRERLAQEALEDAKFDAANTPNDEDYDSKDDDENGDDDCVGEVVVKGGFGAFLDSSSSDSDCDSDSDSDSDSSDENGNDNKNANEVAVPVRVPPKHPPPPPTNLTLKQIKEKEEQQAANDEADFDELLNSYTNPSNTDTNTDTDITTNSNNNGIKRKVNPLIHVLTSYSKHLNIETSLKLASSLHTHTPTTTDDDNNGDDMIVKLPPNSASNKSQAMFHLTSPNITASKTSPSVSTNSKNNFIRPPSFINEGLSFKKDTQQTISTVKQLKISNNVTCDVDLFTFTSPLQPSSSTMRILSELVVQSGDLHLLGTYVKFKPFDVHALAVLSAGVGRFRGNPAREAVNPANAAAAGGNDRDDENDNNVNPQQQNVPDNNASNASKNTQNSKSLHAQFQILIRIAYVFEYAYNTVNSKVFCAPLMGGLYKNQGQGQGQGHGKKSDDSAASSVSLCCLSPSISPRSSSSLSSSSSNNNVSDLNQVFLQSLANLAHLLLTRLPSSIHNQTPYDLHRFILSFTSTYVDSQGLLCIAWEYSMCKCELWREIVMLFEEGVIVGGEDFPKNEDDVHVHVHGEGLKSDHHNRDDSDDSDCTICDLPSWLYSYAFAIRKLEFVAKTKTTKTSKTSSSPSSPSPSSPFSPSPPSSTPSSTEALTIAIFHYPKIILNLIPLILQNKTTNNKKNKRTLDWANALPQLAQLSDSHNGRFKTMDASVKECLDVWEIRYVERFAELWRGLYVDEEASSSSSSSSSQGDGDVGFLEFIYNACVGALTLHHTPSSPTTPKPQLTVNNNINNITKYLPYLKQKALYNDTYVSLPYTSNPIDQTLMNEILTIDATYCEGNSNTGNNIGNNNDDARAKIHTKTRFFKQLNDNLKARDVNEKSRSKFFSSQVRGGGYDENEDDGGELGLGEMLRYMGISLDEAKVLMDSYYNPTQQIRNQNQNLGVGVGEEGGEEGELNIRNGDNTINPDEPALEVFLRSFLPWNNVDGV